MSEPSNANQEWTELEMEQVCRLMFQLGFHTRYYSQKDDPLFEPLAKKMGRSVGSVKSEMAYYQWFAGFESVQKQDPIAKHEQRKAVFDRVLSSP